MIRARTFSLALLLALAGCSSAKQPAPSGVTTSSAPATPSPELSATRSEVPVPGSSGDAPTSAVTPAPDPEPVRTADPTVPPAAGTYTYEQSGETKAGTFSIPVDKTGTLQIYAATRAGSGFRQRQVRRYSDKESGDQQLLFNADGIYVESSTVTLYGFSQECKTEDPLLGVRLPLRVGATWSDRDSCSGMTINVSGRILREEKYTVGGRSVDTFVVRVVAKASGEEGSQTTTETMWLSPQYRLSVHSVSDAKGQSQGFDFERHVVDTLRSLTPS